MYKKLNSITLRHDFTLNLVYGLAFGTPKFYTAPYDKINLGLVNLSYNCDVKSGLKVPKVKLLEFANNVDPDEAAHLELHFLLSILCILSSNIQISWMKHFFFDILQP